MNSAGKASAISVEWHQPRHFWDFLYELAVSELTFLSAHKIQLQKAIQNPDPEEELRTGGAF